MHVHTRDDTLSINFYFFTLVLVDSSKDSIVDDLKDPSEQFPEQELDCVLNINGLFDSLCFVCVSDQTSKLFLFSLVFSLSNRHVQKGNFNCPDGSNPICSVLVRFRLFRIINVYLKKIETW